MEKILRNFAHQFSWKPKIENENRLMRTPRTLVCGMGGSRLAADLVRSALPAHDVTIHADFGFPPHVGNDTLFVVSSYSGNTEETLDAFRAVRAEHEHIAVIGSGGTLLKEARAASIPCIEIPEHDIPPRLAVGYSVKGLLAFIGDESAAAKVAATSVPETFSDDGKKIAERIRNTVPLIYASRRMGGLAYYWKVVLNETAKVHAFANVFPEAGHNEIEGFEDIAQGSATCITLADPEDDVRVQRRLAIFGRMCREKEISIVPLALSGANTWERMLRSVTLANWTAYHLARLRDVDPAATPLIDEWKKELRG